jgi:hypothetical protein
MNYTSHFFTHTHTVLRLDTVTVFYFFHLPTDTQLNYLKNNFKMCMCSHTTELITPIHFN